MSKKILYNFASRSRPEKFFEVLNSVVENSSNDNYQIICTADVDDETMMNEKVRDRVKFYANTKIYYGVSGSKVYAINKNIPLAENDWGVLVNLSDDQPFIKKGFDNDIREAAENFEGLIHFPDQLQKANLCTMAILTRNYYEQFGYIYNPDYYSVYCDNEMTTVARQLDKYKFVNKDIFLHLHYRGNCGVKDELMERNDSNMVYIQDKATFERRKANNFDLMIPIC